MGERPRGDFRVLGDEDGLGERLDGNKWLVGVVGLHPCSGGSLWMQGMVGVTWLLCPVEQRGVKLSATDVANLEGVQLHGRSTRGGLTPYPYPYPQRTHCHRSSPRRTAPERRRRAYRHTHESLRSLRDN